MVTEVTKRLYLKYIHKKERLRQNAVAKHRTPVSILISIRRPNTPSYEIRVMQCEKYALCRSY